MTRRTDSSRCRTRNGGQTQARLGQRKLSLAGHFAAARSGSHGSPRCGRRQAGTQPLQSGVSAP
eukprot:8415770-Pyramimonas_sp.AAC.1